MKISTFILSLSLLTGIAGSTQAQSIDKYFGNIANDNAFTRIDITGKMMQLASHIEGETPEEKQMLEAMSKIDGIAILAAEKIESSETLYRESAAKLKLHFDELMTITDNEGKVQLFINEAGGVITELLVVATGNGGFALVDVYGEIDLSTIRDITKAMQVTELDKANPTLLQDAASIQYYPNPCPRGNALTIQMGESITGGTLTIYDTQGKKVASQLLNNTRNEVQTSQLPAGSYTLSIDKDNVRLFNKVLVVK
ncbi:MAG: DUF4252 domain-containing protein [Flavobacteriales bacterium]|nr:DUF4252 domain-containing protein [Flavobacteriales bacterium]